MCWVAGPRLVSATADAGALGILASATMTFDQLAAAIREVRTRTDRAFGVNLRADAEDADARVDLLVREHVPVASFALAPREHQVKTLKDAGIAVVPSIGARRHAEKVAAWGADAVIVQGGEGGGHTGAVATTLLLPQVVDAVDIPVIAAGGFFDGRGLVAALAYGAAGVAMGTRFLLTQESTVPESVKRFYLARTVADTVVTARIDGVPHRVLRTEFVDELERTNAITALPRALRNAVAFKKMSGTSWRAIVREGLALRKEADLKWSQLALAANTPMLLRAGLVEGRLDAGVLSSGQVAGVIEDLPSVAELIARIMTEAEQTLKHLGELS
jgi:NAD(P)H-dependent flavin oxidoreductase YrpB (nitropropane dioxygenase family)